MRRFRELFTVVGLLVLIVAFYSSNLRHTMQCDEANTLYKYAINPISALFAYTTPNNHLFHSFGVWLTTSLMGFSHIAVRYTAFMASILTVAMAYRVGRKTLNHHSGLASMALLFVSFGLARFTVVARGYTLSAVLTLILIDLIFLSSKDYQSRRHNYAIILVSYLLLMVLPSMMLLIVPILVWEFWRNTRVASNHHLSNIVGICIGGISAFFFYLPSILTGSALEHLGKLGEPNIPLLLSRWLELLYSPFIFGVISLVATGVGIAFLIVKLHRPSLLVGILLILAMAIGTAVVQYTLTERTLYARNFFYLLPVMTLLGGIGLSVVMRRWTTPFAIIMTLAMSIYAPQIPEAPAIDQLIRAIPQYQPESELLGNHACHILPAYYEITETQGDEIRIWTLDSQAQSVMIPIPVGFKMSVERAVANNNYTMDEFSECHLVDDEFDWLDIYICTPK